VIETFDTYSKSKNSFAHYDTGRLAIARMVNPILFNFVVIVQFHKGTKLRTARLPVDAFKEEQLTLGWLIFIDNSGIAIHRPSNFTTYSLPVNSNIMHLTLERDSNNSITLTRLPDVKT
jgi:hypothetical protein